MAGFVDRAADGGAHLASLHQRYGHLPMVQHAISGMAAAACGLLVAMGVKMAWLHPKTRAPWRWRCWPWPPSPAWAGRCSKVLLIAGPMALLWAARER